jgi:hypothetical protein
MLGLAAAPEAIGPAATLSWTHSIEKTLWTEHWRATPAGLVIDEASVEGSGAGMEPSEGSILKDGAWHWTPTLPPMPEVMLGNAGVTAPWRLCSDNGACRDLIAPPGEPIRLFPCP